MVEVPTLVFDGRCAFCRRFIPRWRQLTGERVRYVAFVEDDEVPLEGIDGALYRTAVHLALPDGRVLTGAAAVAELGRYTNRTPAFWWAYHHVPLAQAVLDRGYRFVASHRVLTSRVLTTFVGRDLRRPRQVLTRWLFLRLLGLTALCAVLSWWVQIDGLVGEHGIAPAADFMQRVSAYADQHGALEAFHQVPTLAWISASNSALHWMCGLTTLGALLLLFNVLPGPAVIVTWLGYLSLVSTGGVFMGFQWDALLLESLFLALFVLPWRGFRPGLQRARAPSWAGVWLIRLLVLKLMFLSGAVKLASADPTWADFSALDFHYWTQPLPTFTSHWAANAPAWTRDVGIRVMFACELVLPWLMLTGVRRLRYGAAFGTFALMIAIGITGNYGYFNLLACTLAVLVLDDSVLLAFVPRRFRDRLDSQAFAHARPPVPSRIPVALLAAMMFALSLNASILRLRTATADPPAWQSDIAAFIAPFHLANSYGLFATMTTERPEIELAGSADGITWKPYRFAWKPALDATPAFAGPHMPRLDWQLWFAALAGDCQNARWYLSFAARLLEGEHDVIGLLAEDPFPEGAPRYLKSDLAFYTFTTADEHAASGRYWTRDPAGSFCPTLTLRDGHLAVVGD